MEIEYDGTNYSGWQYQPNKKTIQGELEKTLSQLYQREIKVIGASRTDAGVSAQGQIANFHIASLLATRYSLKAIQHSLNAVLPNDIYVKRLKIVPERFHARFLSKGKIYQYQILIRQAPLRQRFAWFVPYKLNLLRMRKATRLFLKQKDYSSFCKVSDKNGIVAVKSVSIRKRKDEILISIKANRFLYKMVRRIIGALVEVGRNHRTEEDIKNSLAGRETRTLICAPAQGLKLMKVKY